MHDEFKLFTSLDVKYSKIIKFSKGGNFLACLDGYRVKFYDCYTGFFIHQDTLNTIPETEITSIAFNDNDISFAVAGTNGYIGRWELPTFTLIKET